MFSISSYKSKLLPNSYPGMCQFGCNCAGQYIDEMKKGCLHDPWSTKKLAWQQNGNHQAPQNTQKSLHGQ